MASVSQAMDQQKRTMTQTPAGMEKLRPASGIPKLRSTSTNRTGAESGQVVTNILVNLSANEQNSTPSVAVPTAACRILTSNIQLSKMSTFKPVQHRDIHNLEPPTNGAHTNSSCQVSDNQLIDQSHDSQTLTNTASSNSSNSRIGQFRDSSNLISDTNNNLHSDDLASSKANAVVSNQSKICPPRQSRRLSANDVTSDNIASVGTVAVTVADTSLPGIRRSSYSSTTSSRIPSAKFVPAAIASITPSNMNAISCGKTTSSKHGKATSGKSLGGVTSNTVPTLSNTSTTTDQQNKCSTKKCNKSQVTTSKALPGLRSASGSKENIRDRRSHSRENILEDGKKPSISGSGGKTANALKALLISSELSATKQAVCVKSGKASLSPVVRGPIKAGDVMESRDNLRSDASIVTIEQPLQIDVKGQTLAQTSTDNLRRAPGLSQASDSLTAKKSALVQATKLPVFSSASKRTGIPVLGRSFSLASEQHSSPTTEITPMATKDSQILVSSHNSFQLDEYSVNSVLMPTVTDSPSSSSKKCSRLLKPSIGKISDSVSIATTPFEDSAFCNGQYISNDNIELLSNGIASHDVVSSENLPFELTLAGKFPDINSDLRTDDTNHVGQNLDDDNESKFGESVLLSRVDPSLQTSVSRNSIDNVTAERTTQVSEAVGDLNTNLSASIENQSFEKSDTATKEAERPTSYVRTRIDSSNDFSFSNICRTDQNSQGDIHSDKIKDKLPIASLPDKKSQYRNGAVEMSDDDIDIPVCDVQAMPTLPLRSLGLVSAVKCESGFEHHQDNKNDYFNSLFASEFDTRTKSLSKVSTEMRKSTESFDTSNGDSYSSEESFQDLRNISSLRFGLRSRHCHPSSRLLILGVNGNEQPVEDSTNGCYDPCDKGHDSCSLLSSGDVSSVVDDVDEEDHHDLLGSNHLRRGGEGTPIVSSETFFSDDHRDRSSSVGGRSLGSSSLGGLSLDQQLIGGVSHVAGGTFERQHFTRATLPSFALQFISTHKKDSLATGKKSGSADILLNNLDDEENELTNHEMRKSNDMSEMSALRGERLSNYSKRADTTTSTGLMRYQRFSKYHSQDIDRSRSQSNECILRESRRAPNLMTTSMPSDYDEERISRVRQKDGGCKRPVSNGSLGRMPLRLLSSKRVSDGISDPTMADESQVCTKQPLSMTVSNPYVTVGNTEILTPLRSTAFPSADSSSMSAHCEYNNSTGSASTLNYFKHSSSSKNSVSSLNIVSHRRTSTPSSDLSPPIGDESSGQSAVDSFGGAARDGMIPTRRFCSLPRRTMQSRPGIAGQGFHPPDSPLRVKASGSLSQCNGEDILAQPGSCYQVSKYSVRASSQTSTAGELHSSHCSHSGVNASRISLESNSSIYSSAEDQEAGEIRKLKQELESARARVMSLSFQLSTNEQIVSAFEQSLASMNQRVQQLALSTNQKDSELNELRSTIEQIQKRSGAISTFNKVTGFGSISDVQSMSRHTSINSVTSSLDNGDVHSINQNASGPCHAEKRRKHERWLVSFGKAFSRKKNKMVETESSASVPVDKTETRIKDNEEFYKRHSTISEDSLKEDPVEHLKQQLHEKDMKLTDVRLEALSSAHQLDQLRSSMNRMKMELTTLKTDKERLQHEMSLKSSSSSCSSTTSCVTSGRLTDLLSDCLNTSYHQDSFAVDEWVQEKTSISVRLNPQTEMTNILDVLTSSSEIFIGCLSVTGETSWALLYKIVKQKFKEYLAYLDPDTSLGLNENSIDCIHVGDIDWADGYGTPELLPCGYLVGDVSNISVSIKEMKSVDMLSFETLIPKSYMQRYVSLLTEHRRIILYGPTGTGKTFLARKLAEYIVLRSGVDLTSGSIATFNVDRKSSRELRQYLSNVVDQCEYNAANMPSVIILDGLHHVASLADTFEGLLSVKSSVSPYIIGTMSQSGVVDTSGSATKLQLHHNFRWILCSNHLEPILGFLSRYLRRRILDERVRKSKSGISTAERSVDECGMSLATVVHWLPVVWQRVNKFLEAHGSSEITIGPRLFTSCPMSLEGTEVWFTDLWNYSVIPYLLEAIRNGIQTHGVRAAWGDPTDWIVSTNPWMDSDFHSKLLRLRPEDVGYSPPNSFVSSVCQGQESRTITESEPSRSKDLW